ncbi:circadian clock protein KaiC [Sediminicurvatus halobius]|uniref:non-specific serine/threonine protein kinase n=1 Tax=Sediminicurvatus halobius TaxID=2182432 RepID=A0A2U2N9K6_9GAMM|nr:circadian clock protein KaiC [Spiribacter halobius]PWG65778.1 hypothetical protein DEM34_00495 [Spiribacter halobius]UEX77819.1 circadian clock protein KaiC [Spiribacter halobius]
MSSLAKRATGIAGLDDMTRGGLPAGRPCLVVGEPGSGKTLLGLNILANALAGGDGAVFVSFEEPVAEVLANTASFPWELERHAEGALALIDARPPADAQTSGRFDLDGLLAGLGAAVTRTGAAWVVVDGIDQLLDLLGERAAAVTEMRRLLLRLTELGVTALVTAKRDARERSAYPGYMESVEYLVPTLIRLNTEVVDHRLMRKLRIAKYRGSEHVADEVPMVMSAEGVRMPMARPAAPAWQVFTERVSTGVQRLDGLLGGGVHRGSSTLISGAPGTSKTTLASAFVAAAAARGEKALMVSFDEAADQIVRNVSAVGIDLETPRRAGRLLIESRRTWNALVEAHFMDLLDLIEQEAPACVVIDPVSALFKAGGSDQASLSIEHLIDEVKARGITTVLTSLANDETGVEGTVARVSTIADTWLVLGYQVSAGERNRSLSIVKSRGTRHSNQVRELVLADSGPDLEDVYTLGSEVLMGTMRLQREAEAAAADESERRARDARVRDVSRQLEQTRLRVAELEREAKRLEEELQDTEDARRSDQEAGARHRERILRSREGADRTPPSDDAEANR